MCEAYLTDQQVVEGGVGKAELGRQFTPKTAFLSDYPYHTLIALL